MLADYAGHDATAAVADLRAGGFVAVVREQPSTDCSRGTVVSQTPNPGAEVQAHSTVTLFVSSGPPGSVHVPDLTGMTETAARAALSSLGLILGAVTTRHDATASGRVIGSDPSAGATADTGGSVALTISSGPQRVALSKSLGVRAAPKAATASRSDRPPTAAFDVTALSFDSSSQAYDDSLGAHILCTSKATDDHKGLKVAWHAEWSRYGTPTHDGAGSTFRFVIPGYRPNAIYTITMTVTDSSGQTDEAMVSIDVDWAGKTIGVSY